MDVAAISAVSVATLAAMKSSSACYCKSIAMEIRWARKPRSNSQNPTRTALNSISPVETSVPLYISANPSHVQPQQLRRLFALCNHSCHRFPKLIQRSEYGEAAATAAVEDVDVEKLGIALSHSSVLVSVFCKPRDVGIRDQEEEEKGGDGLMGLGDVLQRLIPPALMISPSNGQLVGFGRAVSDSGLTASIHDVVVVPQLRGMGIGKMILQKITRILISRDIYDIAALCSANERSFFKACGFGDDILGSTTMMYTRTAPTCDNAGGDYQDHMAKRVGRKLLLIPPPRELPSLKVTVGESAED
ncbi:unnamed protein product [Linum tenue]|uniref:N-acetyltransferase domain-containing protein n=1 Tax=Linum tenue TaxID=586396 RepID=A0AAV0NFE4_9ROSI|nr:unnamed protein product [Linum tenue]